jgi:autotransporter-associated beta strand protein
MVNSNKNFMLSRAKISIKKTCLSKLLLCAISSLNYNFLFAQQNVYHRSGSGTNLWWSSAANPWWYQTWNNNQERPDLTWRTPNDIFIGHNDQLTMDANGSDWYYIRQLTFQSAANQARTISNSGTARISIRGTGATRKIENLSSAKHVLNIPIGFDAGDSEINPTSGDLELQKEVYLNTYGLYIYGPNSKMLTISGIISGTGSKVVLKQYSKLLLTRTNTYTGNTEIDEGEIWIGDGGDISSSSAIWVGNTTLMSKVSKFFISKTGGGQTFSRNININNGNTDTRFVGSLNNTGTNTLSGNILRNSNEPLTIEVPESGGTFQVSGTIDGSGEVKKIGAGTAIFSNTNSYTGATRITAGTLTVASGGNLGSGSNTDVYISSGATLNINTNTTIASIQETANSNGGVVAIGNGATLTINGSNKGTMFQNSISGQGGLTMAGSGNSMLSLYGSQTYTGTTTLSGGALDIPVGTATSGVTVSGGNLYIKNNGALGSGTLTLSGGTLDVDAARAIANAISLGGNFTFTGTNSLTQTSGGITLTATPTITVSASTLSLGGAIGGSFGITKSGSGTLALAGVNTYTGLTTVSAGTLHINASGGCIPSANDIAVSGGTLRVSHDQIIDDLTATSGTITVDAGKTLTVNGKLSISNGVTINLNSTGKIAYGPNADLEFTGSATISDAVWPATGGPTDIIVNGSGITVTLDKSRTISGNMTLTSGVVTLGNYDLTVTGSLTGGGATAYINTGGTGKLIRSIATATQVTYPVGNVAYSPITLNFASGTFSSATASVKVATGKHPSNIAASSYINRYWEVNQTGISSFSCNVSCTYQQSDVFGTESDIYAGKYSGTTWTPGSAADVNNNILLFNNATSFSDFTGGELSAMPVSWLFFNCKPDKNHINLTWGVSEEPATGIYTIERSIDGRNWEAIGTKTPSGQSFTTTSYHFADLKPVLQAYYRIKHTENLNDVQYSEMCFAQMKPEEKPKIKMDVTNNQIIVSLPTLSENTSTISLYDLCGRKLKSILATKTHGHITTSDLPSGIYELIIEHPGYRHAEKILIFN